MDHWGHPLMECCPGPHSFLCGASVITAVIAKEATDVLSHCGALVRPRELEDQAA